MRVTIRPAIPADAEALTAVARAGKRHWGYPEAWLEAWGDLLTITPEYLARNVVCCAEDATGRVVGFYGLEHDGDRFRMEDLFLAPAAIGCGLGRQLFEHAVATARALGATLLVIEADPNAEGFYLRMGAERIGESVSRVTGTERVVPRLRYELRETAPQHVPGVAAVELTAAQERALRRLVGLLDQPGACYQFTGGFAGNLHGSRWPLHDLDVDVARADLSRVAELLRPYTTRPLGLYVDHEFELQLLRAEIEGVAIDISQAEEAYARIGGRRVPLGTSLAHRRRVRVLDLEVWVQPLGELIAYKELLGRAADLADLRRLHGKDREPPCGSVSALPKER
jgi:GNAT superfamily N-acetyltransferase